MRKSILTMVVSLLIFALCLSVAAHPGRTDSQGGHRDSSTGEYHCHHGYPAHQHYDIDGDGTPDCPYDFDDKTGKSSGSGNAYTSATSATTKTEAQTSEPAVSTPSTSTQESDKSSDKNSKMRFAPIIIAIVIFMIYRSNKLDEIESLERKISFENERHVKELDVMESQHQDAMDKVLQENADSINRIYEIVDSFHDDLMDAFGDDCILIASGANELDEIDEWFYPIGDDYIFRCSNIRKNILKYHRKDCYLGRGLPTINAKDIAKDPLKYVPCKVCNPVVPDVSWTDKVEMYNNLFKEAATHAKETK